MPAPTGSGTSTSRDQQMAPERQPPPSPPLSAPFFVANHHRSHNPDDPKLRANPAVKVRNKRASPFGGANASDTAAPVPLGPSLTSVPASPAQADPQPSPTRIRLQPRDPLVGGSALKVQPPKEAWSPNGPASDSSFNDLVHDLDDAPNTPPRQASRGMSMLDFLSSEPPSTGTGPNLNRAAPEPVTPSRRPTTASTPASMPLLSAQQQALAATNRVVSDPRGGPLNGERSPLSSNIRRRSSANPTSMAVSTSPVPSRRASAIPAGALSLESELDLDMTSGRNNLTKAQTLPSAIPRAKTPPPPLPVDVADSVVLSVEPLVDHLVMFGSTQTSSNYSLSGTVVLSIPRSQAQTAQHSAPASQVFPTRAASIDQPPSPKVPFHRHTSSVANPGSPTKQRIPSAPLLTIPTSSQAGRASSAGNALSTSPIDDTQSSARGSNYQDGQRPSVKVESLSVTFSGFALYVDHSGRYNSIKLANVSQDLLQEGGCVCYLDGKDAADDTDADPHQLHTASAQSSGPIKYEIEFDLSVPGWLPGSLKSRFGGTFYCLEATAVVDGKQKSLSSTAGWTPPSTAESSDVFGHGNGDRPQFLNPFFAPTGTSGLPRDDAGGVPSWMRARRASHGAVEALNGAGASFSTSPDDVRPGQYSSALAPADHANTTMKVPSSSSSGVSRPTTPGRAKGSWLGKRAKQLQLRSSKKTSTGSGSGVESADERVASKAKEVFGDRRGSVTSLKGSTLNVILPNGKRQLKSQAVVIIIRRCRDVVPVPVARMALIGSDHDLPGLRRDAAPAVAAQPTNVRDVHATLVQSQSGDSITVSVPARRGMVPSASAPALTAPSPLSTELAPAASIGSTAMPATSGLENQVSLTASALAIRQPAGNAEPATAAATTEMVTRSGRQEQRSEDGMLPPAPSAFDMPSDPAKFAAAASAMSSSATSSSLSAIGRRTTSMAASVDPSHARSPPRTSSRPATGSRSSAPMRHFLHRPVLHPPAELGIFGKSSGAEGLPFSLTLSLPSHVQVSGPKSDTLSFGVQIEVGKSDGWNAVRELGGLRLRDMELVCLQTERHSSMPSRTFCSAFPVPPPPNRVSPQDLPVISPSQQVSKSTAISPEEIRLRQGYDRELVIHHLTLIKDGNAPDPVANNVERTRTTIVGPPPAARSPKRTGDGTKGLGRRPNDKGKGKEKDRRKAKDNTAPSSGASTPTRNPFAPAAQLGQGSGNSVMQPRPRSAIRAQTSSSSLRNATPSTSASAMAPPNVTPADESGPSNAAGSAATGAEGQSGGDVDSRSVDASTATTPKPVSRRRRGFQNAMSRLSNLANSMLDAGADYDQGQDDESPNGRAGENGLPDETSTRATYVFSGDDGEGVDLTRGRVRMTINLPLVSSDPSVARSKGSAQLLSDFESPYIRIRHKLKVKLGFGLNRESDREEQSWSQALVMCVPVRFTESPPKEVQDQFAPMAVRPAAAEGSSTRPSPLSSSFVPVASESEVDGLGTGSVPLLPAYTQLFREDGSRLADEGEDLPQYPGRMSVTGEIVVEDPEETEQALHATGGNTAAPALGGIPEASALESSSENVAEERAAKNVSASGVLADGNLGANETSTARNLPMPTPMDRSTSLPGHRALRRALSRENSGSPLKNSTSSSMLQKHSTGHEGFASRPPMRQRSATSASLISFSRIAPAEVVDEALMLNALEDDEARRDAMNAEEDGGFTEGEGEATERSSNSHSSAERRMSEEDEGERTFRLNREEDQGERRRMNSDDDDEEELEVGSAW